MKKVIQIKLRLESKDELLSFMKEYNFWCNYVSGIAFQNKIFNWLALQRLVYRDLRNKEIPTNMVVTIVRKVAHSYKNKKRRNKRAYFKSLGSVPLYRHNYKVGNIVQFYGLKIPFILWNDVILSGKNQAVLLCRKGKFYINQVIEAVEPELMQTNGYLGCDLGVRNILTDSDGNVYTSGFLKSKRYRALKLRAKLQSKGTKSAKRLLRYRRRKESLFARWINHNISRRVVGKAKDTFRGIALEDLKHIRKSITVRKAQRYQLSSWSFGQLRSFIEYKAQEIGVPVVIVNPKNTSRTCCNCGYMDKKNRKSQALFLCTSCGFSGHADTIAAGIIASRASGNKPNVDYSVMNGIANS